MSLPVVFVTVTQYTTVTPTPSATSMIPSFIIPDTTAKTTSASTTLSVRPPISSTDTIIPPQVDTIVSTSTTTRTPTKTPTWTTIIRPSSSSTSTLESIASQQIDSILTSALPSSTTSTSTPTLPTSWTGTGIPPLPTAFEKPKSNLPGTISKTTSKTTEGLVIALLIVIALIAMLYLGGLCIAGLHWFRGRCPNCAANEKKCRDLEAAAYTINREGEAGPSNSSA